MEDFYDVGITSKHWELNDGEHLSGEALRRALYNRNFYFLKSTKVARLRELYVRAQRGMRSYEGFTRKELEHEFARRGIPLLNPCVTTGDLKTELEQYDDEHNNFHRFLDLPPELRERIYIQYLITYDDPNSKRQPPISYASSIVRREVLPLFYECCRFELHTGHVYIPFDKPITDQRRIADVLFSRSAAFMKSLSAPNLGYIRYLHLNFCDCGIDLNLDARKQKDPISIETPYVVHLECNRDQAKHDRREKMSSDLRAIALDVAAREGPLKLREEDLERMYEIVRIAFVQLYPQR